MRVQERRLLVVGPGEGKSVSLGGLGVDFKVWGHETGGRFAIVEHPIDARRLIPPHTHKMEDELSYVLEGRVGVRVGDEVAEAGPGTYIYKPCGVPHTFWNPTDQPARLLEIICKAGFENYFVEISELFATGAKPGGTEHEAIAARYNESHFMDWVPELKARYGLKLLGEA
ncbi:MAG: cupin domain-containing protein [Chloroflexi bacterium]|nr:MAG: cupin domain-containing protein [Chloroflexota bacterium]